MSASPLGADVPDTGTPLSADAPEVALNREVSAVRAVMPLWKAVPVLLMLVLFIFVPALNAGTVGIMVPVSVVFTIGVSRILYRKGVL